MTIIASDTQTVTKLLRIPTPPNDGFWDNDLEIGTESIMKEWQEELYQRDWIERLTKKQLDIIFPVISGKNVKSSKRKNELLSHIDDLRPFVFIRKLSRIHREAIRSVAEKNLPTDIKAICMPEGDEDIDRAATLFALYLRDPSLLKTAFHFDHIQRHGMACMQLSKPNRQPEHSIQSFLDFDRISRLLLGCDEAIKDGRNSQLRDVLVWDNDLFVFVRRGLIQSRVLRGSGEVIFGDKPEWIVLHYSQGGRNLRIGSDSNRPSVIIANSLASSYYQNDCDYVEKREVAYSKQIEKMLEALYKNPAGALTLVEVSFTNAPIEGSPKLSLSCVNGKALVLSIDNLNEIAQAPLLQQIPKISGIKVQFCNKRIDIIFSAETQASNEFVVRYGESRLSTIERIKLESYMKEHHGITIISNERRSKNASA